MVEPVRSSQYFARVFVEMGAPTWPNRFDLDPINLYMQMRDAGALTQVAAESLAIPLPHYRSSGSSSGNTCRPSGPSGSGLVQRTAVSGSVP
jgi:hypothetical protein